MSDATHTLPTDPTAQLSNHAYYQLIHTLTSLLPAPLSDTPEALASRNQAAIARIAALAPLNADEADIAAHCVAARAQAEDTLRLLRQHASDLPLVMKLNAQFALMERTSVALRNQLLRIQTARLKREQDSGAASADEWTRYIATRQSQQALDLRVPPAIQPTQPAARPTPSAEPPPAPMPAQAPPEPEPRQPAPPAQAPAVTPSLAAPTARANRRRRTTQEREGPPRDLAAEADYYATVYPNRARPIRQYGALPPDCDFGLPDDDLVRAIATGTSPALRALDSPAPATG